MRWALALVLALGWPAASPAAHATPGGAQPRTPTAGVRRTLIGVAGRLRRGLGRVGAPRVSRPDLRPIIPLPRRGGRSRPRAGDAEPTTVRRMAPPLRVGGRGARSLPIANVHAEHGLEAEHVELLERLGVRPGGRHPSAQDVLHVPVRSSTLRGQRERVELTAEARDALTHLAVDRDYGHPDVRLSHPERYQRRVDAIFGALTGRVGAELGTAPASFTRGVAVVEGGPAEDFNAVTLANGAVVVHRTVVDTADRVGLALAAARRPRELLANLRRVAAGRFEPPAGVDRAAAVRYADAFIAAVVAHEVSHGLRGDAAATGDGPTTARAREAAADEVGAELASRAGFSPLGQAAVTLLFSLEAPASAGRADDHPAGIDRYRALFGHLTDRASAVSVRYDAAGRISPGSAYFTAAGLRELALLPKPEALEAATARPAIGRRLVRGAASLLKRRSPPGS